MDPDDAQLVEAIRRGERDAFRILVERYQQRVYAMALSILKDPNDARDAAQDVFLKVLERVGEFQGRSSFATWLVTVTVHLCIDRQRRAGRWATEELDEDAALPDAALAMAPSPLGFDPARALADSEIRERVLGAMAELTEAQRVTLVLREVEGLSYGEIADVMRCNKATAMTRLHYARKKMQELLSPLVDEPVPGAGDAERGPADGEA